MNLLHIDSSILGDNSVSRTLSAAIVARLKSAAPGVTETYRDLAAAPVAHLSGAYLLALQSPAGGHEPAMTADLAVGAAVLREFQAADTVVVGIPMYNFGVSSLMKAWVDRIVIAGQTFRYGEDGRPVGLAGGKRVIMAVARGGVYADGSPIAAFEHAESYLRVVFGFLGVNAIEAVVAEGLAYGPEHRNLAIAAAKRAILALAA